MSESGTLQEVTAHLFGSLVRAVEEVTDRLRADGCSTHLPGMRDAWTRIRDAERSYKDALDKAIREQSGKLLDALAGPEAGP